MSLTLPARVITLDMDGTLYDPWHCCYGHDHSNLGTLECRHARKDVLKRIRHLATLKDAEFVILSYRSSFEVKTTLEWLAHIGIRPWAVYHLGSPDVKALEAASSFQHLRHAAASGQASYKSQVVARLQALGVEVVGSFDDNAGVIKAIRALGVKIAVQVPYLVEVDPKIFNSGRHKARHHGDRYIDRREAAIDRGRQPKFLSGKLVPSPSQGCLFDIDSDKWTRNQSLPWTSSKADDGFNPMACSGD